MPNYVKHSPWVLSFSLVFTLILLGLGLVLNYLLYRCHIQLCYIFIFDCGLYILYEVFGPEALFGALVQVLRLLFKLISAMVKHRTYRSVGAILVICAAIGICIVLPCVRCRRRLAQEDRLAAIEQNLYELNHQIENAQRVITENQNRILELLEAIHHG